MYLFYYSDLWLFLGIIVYLLIKFLDMKKYVSISLFASTLCIVLLLNSCSKEQIALNKLAGDWNYVGIKLLGITVDPATLGYTSATLHFDKCAGKVQRCGGVQTLNGTENNFQYEMNDDGTVVSVYKAGGGTDQYNITELTNTKLQYNFVISGITYEFILDKR